MKQIHLASEVRELDAAEIEREKITGYQLMERSADAIYKALRTIKRADEPHYIVFAGPGNNGGDAFCVARRLVEAGKSVMVFLVHKDDNLSEDCRRAKRAFQKVSKKLEEASAADERKFIKDITEHISDHPNSVIIDGLLGSGCHRTTPLPSVQFSLIGAAIASINNHKDKTVTVSIDMPSGMMGEENLYDKSIGNKNFEREIVIADYTFALQYPKLSLMLPEFDSYTGNLMVLDIGIETAKKKKGTVGSMIEIEDVRNILKDRPKYGHKGTFGNGCLIAGSPKMMGAAMMSAKASMRSGLGLLRSVIPNNGVNSMLSYLPETLCFDYNNENDIAEIIADVIPISDAVAIGSGIGQTKTAEHLLGLTIAAVCTCGTSPKLVIDADGINILSKHKEMLSMIPAGTILTPHPKEFERLVGDCKSRYEMMEKQRELSKKYGLIFVLKGAYTSISTPENFYFNSTGNNGMATAGSGDVLTGICLSMLSQGYTPEEAALISVFIHGLAGDIAVENYSYDSLIATDIIDFLPAAFKQIRSI